MSTLDAPFITDESSSSEKWQQNKQLTKCRASTKTVEDDGYDVLSGIMIFLEQ